MRLVLLMIFNISGYEQEESQYISLTPIINVIPGEMLTKSEAGSMKFDFIFQAINLIHKG